MAKTFIYRVGNVQAIDTEAFGKIWYEMEKIAERQHLSIFRTVITEVSTKQEFFAEGGVFLSMKFFALEKLKIF